MIIENGDGLVLMRTEHLGEREWRSDDNYKFIFSPFGKSVYQTNYDDISIDTGQFFIFNPDDIHKQLNVYKEKFLIEIQPAMIKQTAEQLGLKQTEPEFANIAYLHPQVRQWSSFIRDFLIRHDNTAANQLFLDNSLTQLSILLLEYGAGSHQNEWPVIHAKANINLVMDALKESYTEAWTLDQMATVSRLNKYQFAHHFKEETGLSPYSWLQLYRLFRSQHSLIYTKDSILSIALKYGFKNVSSYNYLFMKAYRKTPTEFRRIHWIEQPS